MLWEYMNYHAVNITINFLSTVIVEDIWNVLKVVCSNVQIHKYLFDVKLNCFSVDWNKMALRHYFLSTLTYGTVHDFPSRTSPHRTRYYLWN